LKEARMSVFEETFLPAAVAEQWFATASCPQCGQRTLRTASTVSEGHWLCTSCSRCWRAVHGRLQAVDPIACAGCARRPRDVCIEAVYGDFPRFGPTVLDGPNEL
jgi:DNA-directed RNA polymerase subunit RPC12/RpoP